MNHFPHVQPRLVQQKTPADFRSDFVNFSATWKEKRWNQRGPTHRGPFGAAGSARREAQRAREALQRKDAAAHGHGAPHPRGRAAQCRKAGRHNGCFPLNTPPISLFSWRFFSLLLPPGADNTTRDHVTLNPFCASRPATQSRWWRRCVFVVFSSPTRGSPVYQKQGANMKHQIKFFNINIWHFIKYRNTR